ncbi:NAD(P)H-dependent glycerol-3-phosphate dehydrogenase [Rhodalgimonas zhirmunskyi]|uniref:Glycerol-3-phosphate dehydrogenase [NAD(P)+] n=1 Tax=Rhodalgimonas zhirmunskyi TaxID=2964767 RepID=A0AAJ1UAK5_9RHOB|nr:NAD(P)H-dependent glycerol-3-phosphate dehydrogenase [Rhodoalgimonas zhirmunskyi]MDQ2094348.1 NAD(P)-dependent glycerol-3-phosphate dehydrogenase [Rhodoalgimonas zhirmunskyi]
MIGVMGAGAFGTALAVSLARLGEVVALWAHDADHVAEMNAARENAKRLPGVALADNIRPTADIPDAGPLILAVPMQRLRGVLETHADALKGRLLIAACKGIDLATHLGPVETIAQVIPGAQPAILTGPSFAADIARGLPTALTLACGDAVLGERLQQALTTPNIRIYRTTDTHGAELGGALKNVIAIAAGAAIGKGMGDSARAALMTRGFAEIRRLAQARGAQPETLMGLSGFGDLVLTCTSDLSRNYRFGLALGRGEAFDSDTTVEGVATARAVTEWAGELGIDMPICSAVAALCAGKFSVAEALQSLLSRPLKEE